MERMKPMRNGGVGLILSFDSAVPKANTDPLSLC